MMGTTRDGSLGLKCVDMSRKHDAEASWWAPAELTQFAR